MIIIIKFKVFNISEIEELIIKWLPGFKIIEPTNLKELIFPYAEVAGKGDVLWPLRFCLSGRDKSPDPFTLLEILGRDVVLERIKDNIEALKKANV
mgnify:CR=1 FL=1